MKVQFVIFPKMELIQEHELDVLPCIDSTIMLTRSNLPPMVCTVKNIIFDLYENNKSNNKNKVVISIVL